MPESAIAMTESPLARLEPLRPRVYRLAVAMLGHGPDADDAAQEVMALAGESIESWRGESSFETWVHAIALNVLRRTIRRRGRLTQEAPIPEDDGAPVAPDLAPLARLAREERVRLVHDAIASLPDALRETFVLREMQGLAYDEIASLQGISAGTVGSRLTSATRQVARFLADRGLTSEDLA
jgi:RNA polymerase sigma-70 factor (ECF subfamily)